ncbi:unnamed protein product [Amoebophrya sp. A120]|nr:unnamed protein product [Amoebophrya sp. A120]|eukprot:GSA120T00001758001.1
MSWQDWPADDGQYWNQDQWPQQMQGMPAQAGGENWQQDQWHGDAGGDMDFSTCWGAAPSTSTGQGAQKYFEPWEGAEYAYSYDPNSASHPNNKVQAGYSKGKYKPKIEYGDFFYMVINADGAPMFKDCNSAIPECGRAELGEVIPCDARARPGKDGLKYVRGFKAEWVLETASDPMAGKIPVLTEVNTSGNKNAQLKTCQFTTVRTIPVFKDPCVYLPIITTIPSGTFIKIQEFVQYKTTDGEEMVMYKLDPKVGPCVDGWTPLKLPGNLLAISETNLKHSDPPVHYICTVKEGVSARWGPTADPGQLIHEAEPLWFGTLLETDTVVKHKYTHEEYAQAWIPSINNYGWFPCKLYVESNHTLHDLLSGCDYRIEWWSYKVVEGNCVRSLQNPSWHSQKMMGPFKKNTRLVACEIIDEGIRNGRRQPCWVKLAPPLAGWAPCFDPNCTKRLLMPLGQSASGKAEFTSMMRNFHKQGGEPKDVMKQMTSMMSTQQDRKARDDAAKMAHSRDKIAAMSANRNLNVKGERRKADQAFLKAHGH